MNVTHFETPLAKPLVETPALRADVLARIKDYLAMTKPGITLMVVLTTLLGFYLGAAGSFPLILLVHALIGTAMVAAGSNALNMLIERDTDARMFRTQDRPLPSGRLQPAEALGLGTLLVAAGILELACAVNLLTAALAALSTTIYLSAYTPMKKMTSLCTLVGAVSGAIPPVMGWTAARNSMGIEAGVLFAILFFWQLPHFLAIAWIYREDYARAGFPMLPVAEPDGASTGRQVLLQTVALLAASLAPALIGLAGGWYFHAAFALGLLFLMSGILFTLHPSRTRARGLFLTSIAYLPLLMIVQAVNK